MNRDTELSKAIEQMRCGSKDGFLVFFNKTFQFSFLWTLHAFQGSIERNNFLAEFYPYLLLHIGELQDNSDALPWIESALPVFFQIKTGTPYVKLSLTANQIPDESAVMAAASIVWSQISKTIIFPEKKTKNGMIFPIIFIGSCAVLILLIGLLTYQRKHLHNSEIDKINEENQIYSTDSEVERFLNGSAGLSPDDSTTDENPDSGSNTTVTDIDNSGNAKGTITKSTEAPAAPSVPTPSVTEPSVETPSVTEPSVETPSVSEPSPDTPSSDTPSAGKPAVTKPSVTEPAVSAPSVTEPSVTAPSSTAPTTDTPAVPASGSHASN